MVRLGQMRQFVGDEVLDDARREQDDAPVEVEAAARTARPPAVAQIAHLHAGRLDADAVGEELDPALKPGFAARGVPAEEVIVGAAPLATLQQEAAPAQAEGRQSRIVDEQQAITATQIDRCPRR